MAEDTEVISTETETETNSGDNGKDGGEQKPSILERIQSHQTQAEGEPKEKQPEPAGEKTEVKPEKKGKQTANERIQSLISEKKGLEDALGSEKATNAELTEKLTGLETKMNEIQEQLSKGKITGKEAEEKAKDATDNLKEWAKSIELPTDLEPFRESLIDLANKIAHMQVGPLKKQIDDLVKERDERAKKEDEEGQAAFQQSVMDRYVKQVELYPHLFDKPEKEGEPANLKPAFEKEAMKFIEPFNMPYTVNGKTIYYNPLLTTEEGIELLFGHLNRFRGKADKAELELEKKERIKRTRTEAPAETVTGSPSRKSVLEIVKEKQKQFGG